MTIRAFSEVVPEAGDTILGYRKTQKEKSGYPILHLEDRKQISKHILNAKSPRLKEEISREYVDKAKEVKNRARNDKRHFMDGIASEAEEAAGRQDVKTLYRITKRLKDDYEASQDLPENYKYGRPISDEEVKI